MNKFSKKQLEHILEDGLFEPEDILQKQKDKIVIRSCNTEDIDVFKGTWTIEILNWGEIKTTLICGDYNRTLFYKDFDEYIEHRYYKEILNK